MTKPLRGVNLGGWLILEKWITPSFFIDTTAVDEYTYCLHASEQQLQKLRHFRNNFITEKDFTWLVEQGINALRLPVGYWAFDGAESFLPTVAYIDKAFRWAGKHGLKILLDVHAVPGSQNGNDHSGRQGEITWHKDQANIAQTLDFIRLLTERYASQPAWLGLAVLNEPDHRLPRRSLVAFYKQAYHIVRQRAPESWVVVSDSFKPRRWYLSLPRWKYPGLRMDYHHYQLFTPQDKMQSAAVHVRRARYELRRKIWSMSRFHRAVIGEWSLALPNETMKGYSQPERERVASQYGQAQLASYGRTDAWFFWTYKTESADLWDFRKCSKLID